MKLRIGIDIDGTLTNFEKFLVENSQDYMRKNHGLELTNPNGYDIDEMYEIEEKFLARGYSENNAFIKAHHIQDEFWNKNFLKYLFKGIRKYSDETSKNLYYNDAEVIIFSSRRKANEQSTKGKLVKLLTILSLKLKGVKADRIMFFDNDYDKVDAIKSHNIDIMFEDKPEMVEEISKFTNVVCINSSYNQDIEKSDRIYRSDDFTPEKIIPEVNEIRKNRGLKPLPLKHKNSLYSKTLKRLNKKTTDTKHTDKWYKRVRSLGKPLVTKKYNPIVLNEENSNIQGSTIVSPNHRSTLDPFFVIATTEKPIHWAGLKRFFDAEDSIFNNSKNPFLCKLTALLFRAIGLIPIERSSENPMANNRDSVLTMAKLIRGNRVIGVFPEGTTNKRPEEQPIDESDRSGNLAFSLLRENPHAKLLPISIQWVKNNDKVGNKVVLNYRTPITSEAVKKHGEEIGNPKFIEAAYDLWKQEIIKGLEENQEKIDEISAFYDESRPKVKQKAYSIKNKKIIR